MTARMVSYVPANCTHLKSMWQPAQVDPGRWQRDMLAARALGFTVVRVALRISDGNATDPVGCFNFNTPTPAQLGRLSQFLGIAKQAGIRVRLVLFDWLSAYDYAASSVVWATAVASACDLSVIDSVELQNEMTFASVAAYAGGSPATILPPYSPSATIGKAAANWAKAMIPVLRSLFPTKPVVVSCTGAPGKDLAAGINGGVTPDVWSWHAYSPLSSMLADLHTAAALVWPLPLEIGETGISSNINGEQGQADYLTTVLGLCAQLGITASPWMLCDAADLASADQALYGLIRTDYSVKPAGAVFLP